MAVAGEGTRRSRAGWAEIFANLWGLRSVYTLKVGCYLGGVVPLPEGFQLHSVYMLKVGCYLASVLSVVDILKLRSVYR